MLFRELFELYYTRHSNLRTRCPENVQYFFSAHGKFWAERNIDEISFDEVQEWVDTVGTASKSSATRAVNQMAAIYAWAKRRGITSCNPCIGVEKFKIKPRTRFLLPDEIERFKAAIDQEKPIFRDLFYMLLLTGARRGNVMAMRWSELDLDLGVWSFDQKNDDQQVLPINPAMAAILERRRKDSKSVWVFPGRKSGHIREPKRAWARILKRAGIENLRIHDLRRTVGSYLAISGESLPVISRVLGHRDPRSAVIYTMLNLKPVETALLTMEQILEAPKQASRKYSRRTH